MMTIKPYKGIVLEFDEAKHRFFANGVPVKSVTGFTSVVDKSGPLMGWQEKITKKFLLDKINEGTEITEEVIVEACGQHRHKTKEASNLGTQVHDWAEKFTLGQEPPMLEDERAKNGVLAFLRWLDESKLKLFNPEEHIYSKKYNYAGIVDAQAKRGKKLVVIDYKTSNGIYNEMRYQTAAYQHALQEMTGKVYDERILVRFDKETADFHVHDLPDFKKDFNAFLACRALRLREDELKVH